MVTPYPRPPARPAIGLPRPVAMQPVPGTPFAIAMVDVAPTVSGQAVASLVAGIGATLVSLLVICFGTVGADAGWGPIVAGAFAVLAGLLGAASLILGALAMRMIKRVGRHRVSGRPVAITGVIFAAVGLAITVVAMLLAVALTV